MIVNVVVNRGDGWLYQSKLEFNSEDYHELMFNELNNGHKVTVNIWYGDEYEE